MSDRRFRKGDVVAFDFTLEYPVAKRTGIGVIADNEVNYQCWPPGYSVIVQSSEDYKPGTHIAVTSHNLRKIRA
jgi:hypothetical protein